MKQIGLKYLLLQSLGFRQFQPKPVAVHTATAEIIQYQRERFSHNFTIIDWTWNLRTKKNPIRWKEARQALQSICYTQLPPAAAMPVQVQFISEPDGAESVVHAELLITR